MIRDIDLSEISDGKKYNCNDLVKIECNECSGCSKCCKGMGDSIVLDPYDVFSLCKGLNTTLDELLAKERIAFRVVDGIILPHMNLSGKEESCSFLNEEGRCSVHEFRPGFCRLFPLGRAYENGGFYYFNQIHECDYPTKTKVKIKHWLGIRNINDYESFICEWHYFSKAMQDYATSGADEDLVKQLNMYLLQMFYVNQFDTNENFYDQFYERLNMVKINLGIA